MNACSCVFVRCECVKEKTGKQKRFLEKGGQKNPKAECDMKKVAALKS